MNVCDELALFQQLSKHSDRYKSRCVFSFLAFKPVSDRLDEKFNMIPISPAGMGTMAFRGAKVEAFNNPLSPVGLDFARLSPVFRYTWGSSETTNPSFESKVRPKGSSFPWEMFGSERRLWWPVESYDLTENRLLDPELASRKGEVI